MNWTAPPDQLVEHPPEVVPLFVYGTLRVGGHQHDRIAPLLQGPGSLARVRGTLCVCSAGPWPVLVPGDDAVLGDVFPVLAGQELWGVLGNWEVAWGYSLRWLPTLDSPQARVLVCVWEWPGLVSERVPSGDWFDVMPAK